MTPCDALRQMMVSTDTEQECADAIGEFEHWSLSPKQRIDRMRQCLSHDGDGSRHFCVNWQPIVLEIVAKAGGVELVTGLLDQARREGEHARRRMLKVEPDSARDRAVRRA